MANKYRGYYKAVDSSGNTVIYQPGDIVKKNDKFYIATDEIVGHSPEHGTRVGWVPIDSGVFTFNGEQGDIVFNDYVISINGETGEYNDVALSTGILFGGGITAAIGGSTFSVEAGIGQIAGYTANLNGVFVTRTEVTWGTFTGVTLNYLTTSDFTRLYIDENGELQQQTAAFDHTDPLNRIILGTISHIDRSTIALVTNKQNVAYNEFHRLYELFDTFGPIKKQGLNVSANGANLRLNRSSGQALVIGSNYVNDFEEPDTVDLDAQTPAVIARIYRDGSGDFVYDTNGLSFYTDVDPTKYDDNSGTLQTVNNNQWTIQRLYMFPNLSNVIMSYYGRVIYNSYAGALAGVQDEVFTEAEITAQNAVFLGYLILRGGAANLTLDADAKIIQSGFCRVSGGGGGAADGGGGIVGDYVSSVNGMTGGVTAGYIHVSASAPASPTEMDFWFETDTGSFYAYIDEGGGAAWVEISADPAIAVTSVNGQTGDVFIYAGSGLTIDGTTLSEIGWVLGGETFPEDVGGVVAGTSFANGTSAIEILETILFPYQSVSFSAFDIGLSSGPYEVGQTAGNSTVNSTWSTSGPGANWVAGSLSISANQGVGTLASGLNYDGSPQSISHGAYNFTSELTLTFTITGQQDQGSNPSRTDTMNWRYRYFSGKTGAGFNGTGLTAQGFTDTLSRTSPNSWTVTFPSVPSPGNHAYFIIPSAEFSGTPLFTDTGTGLLFSFDNNGTFTHTNAYGHDVNYTIFKSNIKFSGERTIRITV